MNPAPPSTNEIPDHVVFGADDESNRVPIRVVVIDDDVLLAQLLECAMSTTHGIEVVATASDVVTGIDTVRACAPDVAAVDYHLPSGSGFEVCATLKETCPNTAMVLLSGDGDPALAVRAIQAGFDGYVSKADPLDAFVNAIKTVGRGNAAFTPTQLAAAYVACRHGSVDPFVLSAREDTVLQLLAEGKNTHEIAELLYVSNNTVRSHVRNVLTKLGAHSRLEAVSIARSKHIMTIDRQHP